jgi:hypothetical protein
MPRVMRTYFLHMDTSSPNVQKVLGNPFNCVIPFTLQQRNVTRIVLKSCEMPVAFYNVKPGLNTFLGFDIPVGNYTTTTLLAAVNSKRAGFTVSAVDNRVSVSPAVSLAAGSIKQGSVLDLLGFSAGDTIKASRCVNINPDTFVYVWFKNLYTSSQENNRVTFKIPVQGVNGTVFNFSDNHDFAQHINVTDPSIIIDRLEIEVRDRYGNVLDNNGVDWSFSLAVEAQI